MNIVINESKVVNQLTTSSLEKHVFFECFSVQRKNVLWKGTQPEFAAMTIDYSEENFILRVSLNNVQLCVVLMTYSVMLSEGTVF